MSEELRHRGPHVPRQGPAARLLGRAREEGITVHTAPVQSAFLRGCSRTACPLPQRLAALAARPPNAMSG